MALITVADVRAEGLTESEASTPAVEASISLAQRLIALLTDRLFEPTEFPAEAPLTLDGPGTPTLFVPHPILRLDTVLLDEVEVELSTLAIYNRVVGEDDRWNPKLVRKNAGLGSRRGPRWNEGNLNVQLVGKFGFVHTDGVSVLPEIKQVALRLVLREYPDSVAAASAIAAGGSVVEEVTDGHSYKLGNLVAAGGGWTGDHAIDDVLALYKRRYFGTSGGP